jgi:hypothetical protein
MGGEGRNSGIPPTKTVHSVSIEEVSTDQESDENGAHMNEGLQETSGKLTWWSIRARIREPLAEFFGVFTLIIFGDGVVAQVVLSKGEKGNYQSINWGSEK